MMSPLGITMRCGVCATRQPYPHPKCETCRRYHCDQCRERCLRGLVLAPAQAAPEGTRGGRGGKSYYRTRGVTITTAGRAALAEAGAPSDGAIHAGSVRRIRSMRRGPWSEYVTIDGNGRIWVASVPPIAVPEEGNGA